MGSALFLPVSGVTDALGNASVTVYGFTPRLFAAWLLNLSVPGNAPSVTVLQAGQLAGSAQVIAGVANVGPINTAPGVPVTVNITGALPNSPFSGSASGTEAERPDDPDLAAMTGTTAGNVGTISPFDGPTLISENGVSHSGNNQYPQAGGFPTGGTFAVQNWASVLLGLRFNSGNPVLVVFRWYANPDGSRLVGQRSLMIDTVVPTAVATIPNLGPYLQVFSSTPLGGVWNWNLSLVASNRLVNDVFGGNFTPYLCEQYAQAVAASTTTDYPFSTVYGGPVWVGVTNNGSSPGQITARIQTMGTDGAYHSGFADSQTVASSVTGQGGIVVLPPVPCQMRIISAGTAGTYTYSVLVYSSASGST